MEKTNCQDIEPLLDGLFDGELSAGELVLAQTHVGECANCRGKLAEIESLNKQLASLPRLAARTDLADVILQKAQSKTETVNVQAKVLIFKRKEVWAIAAACLLLGLTFQFASNKQTKVAQEPIVELKKQAVADLPPATPATAPQKRIKEKTAPVQIAAKQKTLIASSTADDVIAFDYGYQPNLMEGMGIATDEDGLYALKM